MITPGVRRAPRQKLVIKTADETVNNSNTLQDDDELKFAIAANEKWFVEGFLMATGASATADWKFGWTGPTGATAQWSGVGKASDVNGASFVALPVATAGFVGLRSISQNAAFAGEAVTAGFMLAGWFVADSSHSGTIQFQWAQNTATSEDNKVLAGSFLRVTKLA